MSLKKTCTLEEFSGRGWAPATASLNHFPRSQTVPHCLFLLVSVMSPSSTCPALLLPSSLRTILRLLRLSSCSTHPCPRAELPLAAPDEGRFSRPAPSGRFQSVPSTTNTVLVSDSQGVAHGVLAFKRIWAKSLKQISRKIRLIRQRKPYPGIVGRAGLVCKCPKGRWEHRKGRTARQGTSAAAWGFRLGVRSSFVSRAQHGQRLPGAGGASIPRARQDLAG